jgi:hypothetical protein
MTLTAALAKPFGGNGPTDAYHCGISHLDDVNDLRCGRAIPKGIMRYNTPF